MTTHCHTFRTEAAIDLTRLLAMVLPLDPEFLLLGVQASKVGGLTVDCSTVLTRNNMLNRISEVPDGHVMAQTLQTSPAADSPKPLSVR